MVLALQGWSLALKAPITAKDQPFKLKILESYQTF
ncbi:hypothetical protein NEOC95_000709 [Neochlamydia sp. AcF95]|nr:hypothetical protein [Neochlamydia sp. AcF95]